MSDFDEEAEREKLRERFAEEDEKRETTERMSELLLQGATMTDTHCDSCGSPLFRYDSQTFCPTCQQTASDGKTEAQATSGDTPASSEPAPASTDGQQTAAEQPSAPPNGNARTPRNTAEGRDAESAPTRNQRAPPSRTGDEETRKPRPKTTRSADGTDDLAASEASLSRTLRELTSTAEELDDLGRTREHLAAAREAAEALDAVRTARK